MLDHYLWGSADRISPEAPVPVVKIQSESYTLGGAANVANNLIALGAHTSLMGVIGKDKNGVRIQQLLEEKGIQNSCISIDMKTTSKVRVVSQRHQMIRLDWEEEFQNHEDGIDQFNILVNKRRPEYILVSDYGKGFCSPGLMTVVIQYSIKTNTPVLIDPKGKDWTKYQGAFLVKPNLKELEDVLGISISNENTAIEAAGKKLLKTFELKYLVVTRSSKGMSIISSDQIDHIDAIPIDVFDVTGAGDTVLAVIVHHLTKGKSILNAVNSANIAASKVVKKFGVSTL
jgi:D-beta-D-heptose 7-phosphate kinase/D-beta-D-heptose 1-phosphate adenosyltransferase